MKQIYTLGYTAFHNIEEFISILKRYKISCIIDVRSTPIASEHYKIFSKNILGPLLKKEGILYRNYNKEFGARQDNPIYYPNGYLDFKMFTKSTIFNEGVEKIKKGIEMNYTFALMCAEKDPIACHRNIMVSKAIRDNGFSIIHIMVDNTTQTQEDIDKRLLDIYFKEPGLFDLDKSKKEKIEEAYKKQNEKIGFKLENLQ